MPGVDNPLRGPLGPQGPLEGVTVVDLSRVLAGPYCTMVLADLGARVIKVEIPDRGDDARHIGPFINGRSAYFASANRGKESIALDLSIGSGDRAHFERLLDSADVLVENFRPGVMDRLEYGWTAVHTRWPSLIYASTSGFGQTGPASNRPAYDMVVQAMGGIMSITGHPGDADAGGDIDRRHHRRAVHRGRHLFGAVRAGRERRRCARRRFDAGLPGRDLGKRDRAVGCDRRRARSDGIAPSIDHAVRRRSAPRMAT